MWALLVLGLPDANGGFHIVGPFAAEEEAELFADGDDEKGVFGHFARSLIVQLWTPAEVKEYHKECLATRADES